MSSYEEDEESFQHTLLVVREVSVYKIPPRTSSGGYKCGEWLQSDKIWSGRLRVVSCKERCEIRLEDPNSGDLFAACFVYPGRRDSSVETVLDSSRYFVLKIEDGRGKHAFIGLGFNERNEAFDFNVALSDHDKYLKRGDHDKDATNKNTSNINGHAISSDTDAQVDIRPAVNRRLKEGETIRINVKHKPATSGTGCCRLLPRGRVRRFGGLRLRLGLARLGLRCLPRRMIWLSPGLVRLGVNVVVVVRLLPRMLYRIFLHSRGIFLGQPRLYQPRKLHLDGQLSSCMRHLFSTYK